MMTKYRRLLIVALLLVLVGQLGAAHCPSAAQLPRLAGTGRSVALPYCGEAHRSLAQMRRDASQPCNPDVNADLVVDLFDLVRVGSRYGTQWTPGAGPRLPEDTDTDGLVGITDLVCVSSNLGPVFGPVPTVGPAVFATPTPTPTVPAPAACQWAWVEWVTDGDTVRVQLDGKVESVRYINIDAPERNEPYGYEATMMNIELVGWREVCLERDPKESRDRDRYDRLLRYVWVDGLLAEAELVEAGLAEVVSYRSGYQYEPWLLALQAEAQRYGRGLWE